MDSWVNVKLLAKHLQVDELEIKKLLQKPTYIGHMRNMLKDNKTIEQKPKPPFFQKNNITIYYEDFVNTIQLAPESVDLIVTSPPYNVGIDYNNHDDTDDYSEYLKFSYNWLLKAFELSKADGRLCMNIPLDKNKGGQQSVCADLTQIAKDIGWRYHSTIIWNEGNISRRTAWGSWLSASAPYVIAPVEVIVVLYKHHWKKDKNTKRKSDITKQEFMDWTNGMWTFNGESKKRVGHPAPFPRELPKRCIKLFSFVDDVVLDPFLGSGTTLLEAASNNRIGIGFDISHEYCQLAQKRLEALWSQPKLI